MRGTETIVVQDRSTERNRFGDPISEPEPRQVTNCIIVPRGIGGEDNRNASTVISGLQVFCPPGTVIAPTSRVQARGDWYEVDGEPADYRSASGQPRAVLVNLKRVTG